MHEPEIGQPEGMEHVGWIDEYGQLWGVNLRNGAVKSDRKVYATSDYRKVEVRDAE